MSWNLCGFLIICQFISGPFGHIVGIAYSTIAADMLPCVFDHFMTDFGGWVNFWSHLTLGQIWSN